MPKIEQIYKMMEAQQTPYVRVFDLNKNRIYTFDNENIQSTMSEMDTLMPFMSSYGKLLIEAATEKHRTANWSGAYKWILEFDKPVHAGAVAAPVNPWQMGTPPGFVHNDVMMAKLETIQKEISANREIDALKLLIKEKDSSDPMKHIEKLAPAVMLMMGKPIEEIRQLASLYANPMGSGISGPPTNTLTFSDVEKGTLEEKQKKLASLWDEVAKLVTVEQMTIIFDAFIKKTKANKDFPQQIIMSLSM